MNGGRRLPHRASRLTRVRIHRHSEGKINGRACPALARDARSTFTATATGGIAAVAGQAPALLSLPSNIHLPRKFSGNAPVIWLTCILHQRKCAGAICTLRPRPIMQIAYRPWSKADNAKCIVGVRPDNWLQKPIVGPAGACCTRGRATCGLTWRPNCDERKLNLFIPPLRDKVMDDKPSSCRNWSTAHPLPRAICEQGNPYGRPAVCLVGRMDSKASR